MAVLRSTLATVVILLGLVVTALAAPATWVRTHLLDTDEWSAVVAPLIEEQPVRDAVSAALVRSVDSEGTYPTWAREVLASVAADVVATDVFARVWEDAVRISHQHLVEGIRDEGTGLDVTQEAVAVELAPLFAALVPRLEAAGVPGVGALPTPEGRVVLEGSEATAEALRVAGLVDRLAVPAAAAAVALVLLGMLLSRRPARALTLAGLGVVAVAALEWLGWSTLSDAWAERASGTTGRLVVDRITGSVEGWLFALAGLGSVVALVGVLLMALGSSRGRDVRDA